MYKNICAAVVLVLITVLTVGGPLGKAGTTSTSPVIVAKGSFLNQNAAIPPTAIFTPTQYGIYRISTYATITQSDPQGTATWQVILGWSGAGGAQTAAPGQYTNSRKHGGFLNDISVQAGGPTTTIEASAGVPITISMALQGVAGSSEYSLFYVVEEL